MTSSPISVWGGWRIGQMGRIEYIPSGCCRHPWPGGNRRAVSGRSLPRVAQRPAQMFDLWGRAVPRPDAWRAAEQSLRNWEDEFHRKRRRTLTDKENTRFFSQFGHIAERRFENYRASHGWLPNAFNSNSRRGKIAERVFISARSGGDWQRQAVVRLARWVLGFAVAEALGSSRADCLL